MITMEERCAYTHQKIMRKQSSYKNIIKNEQDNSVHDFNSYEKISTS